MGEYIEQIITENTSHIKNREDRKHFEKVLRAYCVISNETGIPLRDSVNHSYCFVKSGKLKGKLFGKIGIYERNDSYTNYFKFGKKLIGFDAHHDEVFWSRNPIILLEEREKQVFSLF